MIVLTLDGNSFAVKVVALETHNLSAFLEVSALNFKKISLKNSHHCGGGGGSVLIEHILQSSKSSLFCSLFESPPLKRKTICKYILRALLMEV